jgi:3',5'-cyclic AMP phosphodiesterase CpdA
MTFIAHISDLHVRPRGQLAYGVAETSIFAERAIEALLRLDPAPDCVLVSGDLTDRGLEKEYDLLCELFAQLSFPAFAIPGNHDRREPFRRAFQAQGYLPASGALDFAVDCRGVRIIGLDSVVEGASHGELRPGSIAFLDAALDAKPAAPALLMLHHPPCETGIAHIDAIRLLKGAEELARVLSAHPQVKRVLCGHVHRPILTAFGGTICQMAPSVAHQVTLDLRPDGPSGFVLEPPGFLLHRITGGGVVTHHAAIDRAPGPFPFTPTAEYPRRAGESRAP